MITIISGTNRNDSMTLRVATLYYDMIRSRADDVHLVSLQHKAVWERGDELKELEQQYFIPAEKFVFILPEYNGSVPGILKLMMDNSDIKKCWWYKKAMLTGVADGRAGNLRGLDHMTNILHYLKMHVLYNKLPLSRINEEVDAEGNILRPATKLVIEQQIEEFLKF
jgi:chromate reductase